MTRLELIRQRATLPAPQPTRPPRVRASKAERLKRWRQAASARGMCSICATTPARPGLKTCRGCVESELRRRRARGHR